MSDDLDDAIRKAGKSGKPHLRLVKPAQKQGRKRLYTSPAEEKVYGPSELADLTGYTRDAIYKMNMPRADGGKGWTLPQFIRFLEARAVEAGKRQTDPDDEMDAEKLRDLRARADMREDERDQMRKKLIEVELAVAIYEDDTAYVAVHLRNLGARLMGTLCTMDDPAEICAVIDAEVERALENLNAEHVDPASTNAHPYLGGVTIEGRG